MKTHECSVVSLSIQQPPKYTYKYVNMCLYSNVQMCHAILKKEVAIASKKKSELRDINLYLQEKSELEEKVRSQTCNCERKSHNWEKKKHYSKKRSHNSKI